MRAIAAFVFIGLAWLPGATTVHGAGLAELAPWLVRISGGMKGVYTPVEGRPLTWSLAWSQNGEAVRRGEITVDGVDARLRVALEFYATDNRLVWRVTEGRIDLASWLPALAGRPELAALAETTVTGSLEITGAGEVVAGVPRGNVFIDWRDGTARNDAQGWSLAGVTLHAGGDVAALAKGSVPVELKVATISTARFGACNFTLAGALNDFDQVAVNSARIEIAGGEVMAEPFTLSLAEPALSVTLVMQRVGLQDLIVFVPTTLSEAHGRINGRLHLVWSPADGVQVGVGELSLDKSEPTTLRLVAAPGFLTKQVPARFVLLPKLGLLKGLFAPKNPSYPTLKEIELGQLGLQVETLEVRLTPEGDALGRSASVFVRARPAGEGSVVREVTFQINVSGPLAAVLRMGMEQKLSIGVR